MERDDPTEELVVDITAEVPEVEDPGENNGPPLMWFGVAALLLAGAIGLIFALGRNRDDVAATSTSISVSVTSSADSSPDDTPPIGDPGASATDEFDSTADTSPPDEGSDEASSTENPTTTAADPDSSSQTSPVPTSAGSDSTSILDIPAGPLILGAATLTVSSDDFEILLATSVCTTIEWSFAGEGQAASYSGEEVCFNEHLLSPRPEHPLVPSTDYEVTASFAADGEMQVVAFSVTTTP